MLNASSTPYSVPGFNSGCSHSRYVQAAPSGVKIERKNMHILAFRVYSHSLVLVGEVDWLHTWYNVAAALVSVRIHASRLNTIMILRHTWLQI